MRKTGKDYRKELTELEKSRKSLDAHARSRVLELAKKYPNAPISSDAVGKHMTKKWLNSLPTNTVIYLIEKIEEWSASQQKTEQLIIDNIYKEAKGKMNTTLKKLSDDIEYKSGWNID